MEFRWNEWNVEHVIAHGVTPAEAERVVLLAGKMQRFRRGDDKWAVWGPGTGGRLLQVVVLFEANDTVYIIHARPLNEREKRLLRRRLR
jgi:uncharacterized DUF497 family protein